MKALFIVSEMPPISSGVARCAETLVSGLRRAGHEIDVISSLDMPRLVLGEFRFSGFVSKWPDIAKSIGSYDVVNLHGPAPTISDAFLLLSRTLSPVQRPPIIYTHHCSIDIDGWRPLCRIYNRVARALAQKADRIVTTSESYRTMMSVQGGPPVSVIPWGVDHKRYVVPRHPPATDGSLRVLFVGQMRPYKGVPVLIEATAGDERFSVTLVGTGPQLPKYERDVERLSARNIRFLGHVEDEQLARLYGEHDVIVLPSTTRAEAFGLALLEGMAAGCVPVASDLPGVRDLAGPTGLVVRPHDGPALRQALLSLALDRERVRDLGVASAMRAAAMGWDPIVRDYEQIFRDSLVQWHEGRGLAVLPRSWQPPEAVLEAARARFSASWSSLLLFDRSRDAVARAGWGRVITEDIHTRVPLIAQYVARTRRPLLLHSDVVPANVREFMMRDEIGSALSVPIRCRGGVLVLNLSIAAGESRRYEMADLTSLVRLTSHRRLSGVLEAAPSAASSV